MRSYHILRLCHLSYGSFGFVIELSEGETSQHAVCDSLTHSQGIHKNNNNQSNLEAVSALSPSGGLQASLWKRQIFSLTEEGARSFSFFVHAVNVEPFKALTGDFIINIRSHSLHLRPFDNSVF